MAWRISAISSASPGIGWYDIGGLPESDIVQKLKAETSIL